MVNDPNKFKKVRIESHTDTDILGTAEEWARLFTKPGQEGLEVTADDAGEEQAKLLLLVNAANGFNNLSRLAMLWTIRHRWPKIARFAFNAYRHQ